MMSPIPVLPDITGDVTSPSPRPWCGSGAGQGRTRRYCPATLCPAEQLEVLLSTAFRSDGQTRGMGSQAAEPPERLPTTPEGCASPRSCRYPGDGGSRGKCHEPGSAALEEYQPSALAVPAHWGQMCALLRLPRYIWSGFWFPSRSLPHPPQPAGGEEAHIWKQLQLSRFKEILHRREENPIPRPSSPLPPASPGR